MGFFRRVKSFFFSEKKEEAEHPPLNALSSGSLSDILGFAAENPDKILKKKGVRIYDEMEAKDPHLYAAYSTRKLAVSRIPWVIESASQKKRDLEIRDFVFTAISDCKGAFCEDLYQLLDGIGKGFSCLEIVWQELHSGPWEGKFTPKELVFHPQRMWRFKDAKSSSKRKDEVLFKEGLDFKPVPWSKVIHFGFDAQDSLYGRAAFRTIYWHWWFKKESWKWWIQFLEKFASPTALGTFPLGSTQKQIDDLLNVLESIQTDTAVVIPDQLQVKFLEAARTGAVSYREMSDAVNSEVSKALLGGTQTIEEGRRGSYALSRAHSQVRQERVEADGILLADVIQEQLIKPLVDFNFVTDTYPQFLLKYPAGSVDSRKGNVFVKPIKYTERSESPQVSSPSHLSKLDGLYIVKRHADLIYEGRKSLIVKARRFGISNRDLYLISGDRVLGIIHLGLPVEIDQDAFDRLRPLHQISSQEQEEWWPGKKKFFAYAIELFQPFGPPLVYKPKIGVQIIQKDVVPQVEKSKQEEQS